jgi:hypothetical protein
MFIRTLALAILVSACSGSAVGADHATEKVLALRSLDDAYRELIDLADRCSKRKCESNGSLNEQEIGRVVGVIVGKINNPEVLFRLAVTSYVSAYPQEAGLQRADAAFDAAWRASVQKLGSLGGGEALAALRSLDHVLQTDAGESLVLKETIERAERAISK